MASNTLLEAMGKNQLPLSLLERTVVDGSTFVHLNNNHFNASAPQSPKAVDPADVYPSPELNCLEQEFIKNLRLSSPPKQTTVDDENGLFAVDNDFSFGLNDAVNSHSQVLPSPSPSQSSSWSIKTPGQSISALHSPYYPSSYDTVYDSDEEMNQFENFSRYGTSPGYIPFDYNTLNPDLNPDDDQYYVQEPLYEYVTLSDNETMTDTDREFEFEFDTEMDDLSSMSSSPECHPAIPIYSSPEYVPPQDPTFPEDVEWLN
ncbi:hypothetical protein BGX28_010046 [Mortierella sp. GBA30]|nr:hypothetical protein BGX28_010046 [Mortierella sp. GBA30]